MAKKLNFYKLAVEIAAYKTLTHSEKLIAAYLFTYFGNGRSFYATNAYMATKLNVQKSSISVCLKKLIQLGWITITNPKGNKRRITMRDNPCSSGSFYKLYLIVAESEDLTSLEKILLSYILSFTDSGKRFYAKNAMVEHILDISKEGFNTSRIKFEELQWITVLNPKSPRRELIVINHPTENMPTEIRRDRDKAEDAENLGLISLENNDDLPENDAVLPKNNDNNINDYISDERITTIKDITEPVQDIVDITIRIDSSCNSISNNENETPSIKNASQEATPSIIPEFNGKETTSTHEVHFVDDDSEIILGEAPISTKDTSVHSAPSFNTINEVGTDSISGSHEMEEEHFNIRDYLNVMEYIRVRSFITELGATSEGSEWNLELADTVMIAFSKEQVDSFLLEMGIPKKK